MSAPMRLSTFNRILRGPLGIALAAFALMATLEGCASVHAERRVMEVTAYCGCGQCCDWERGGWFPLFPSFYRKVVKSGPRQGRPYTGRTANNSLPHEPQPGLVSWDSLCQPWMIPFRLIFWWKWPTYPGTVAADTNYLPFGTRLFIPGYGWGVVHDRGSAIKGPNRLDLYFRSHNQALLWGRRRVAVDIYWPERH